METITQFLVDHKDNIVKSFIEKQCGMSPQSLKPGNVPIPEKYKSKLLDVLKEYYSFPSINLEIGEIKSPTSKILVEYPKDNIQNIGDDILDFYKVPKNKIIYKANNGVLKRKNLVSGQWERVQLVNLFVIQRVHDPINSAEYKDDDILKKIFNDIDKLQDPVIK